MSSKIAIIGAGVIGITNAIVLLEQGFSVTVFSKDQPLDTNSDAAIATWYAPDDERSLLRQLCFDSLPKFSELSQLPESGVQIIPMLNYLNNEETQLTHIPLANVAIYRPHLLNRFRQLGGKLEITKINNFNELAAHYNIIINCAGWEAKYLTQDDAIYPIRGQVEIAKINPALTQRDSFNIKDLEAYVVFRPQSNDVVFGTTRQIGDTDKTARDQDRADIFKKIAPFFPAVNSLTTTTKVGIRCGRSDVRLATEMSGENKTLIIHCYGHDGSGYSASWGSANRILSFCNDYLTCGKNC